MLAREFRLTQEKDVRRILKFGRRFNLPECTLYFAPNRLTRPRIAVVASSGVSKLAVVRNRIKRQARAVLGTAIQSGQLKNPVDYVLVLRAPITKILDDKRTDFFVKFFWQARLGR